MDRYNNNLKLYTKSLTEKSILLKLLNSGEYFCIKDIRQKINNCKWIDTEKKIDVFDFNLRNVQQNIALFYSSVFLNSKIKSINIIEKDNFFNITTDCDIKNYFVEGYTIFIEKDNKNIELGNIVSVNINSMTIDSKIKNLNFIKDKELLIEMKIYSIKNYNKGVCVHLPVINLCENDWSFDCIIDKRTYENDNRLCLNMLDDLNMANTCGILSIGLLGAFIGKISYTTFQDNKTKKNIELEYKDKLLNILNNLQTKNKHVGNNNNDNSINNINSIKNNESNSINNKENNYLNEIKKELLQVNTEKHLKKKKDDIFEREYLKIISNPKYQENI